MTGRDRPSRPEVDVLDFPVDLGAVVVDQALQATQLLARLLSDPAQRESFLTHGWEPGQAVVMVGETEPTGTVLDRCRRYLDQQHTKVMVCVFVDGARLVRFLQLVLQPADLQLRAPLGELREVPIGTVAAVAESLQQGTLFASRPWQYLDLDRS